MEILDRGRRFYDVVFECSYCKCRFKCHKEEYDKDFIDNGYGFTVHLTFTALCPNCGNLVTQPETHDSTELK